MAGENVVAVQLWNNDGSSDAYLDFAATVDTIVVPLSSGWKRPSGNTVGGPAWSTPAFDDSAWVTMSDGPVGYDNVNQKKKTKNQHF